MEEKIVKNKPLKLYNYEEPRLKFNYSQKVTDPRDGIMLFGPFDKGKVNNISVGIIGTQFGIENMKIWLNKIHKPIYDYPSDLAKPFYPGFEEAFGVSVNFNSIKEIEINENTLNNFYKYSDGHVRVSSMVDLYIEAIINFIHENESPIDLWFIVVPDNVYKYGRINSPVPVEGKIDIGIGDEYLRYNEGWFEDEDFKKMRESYYYENNFHNQLKLKLLRYKILSQIIRESTIAFEKILKQNNKPLRDLTKFQTAIAWNLSTSMYYKVGGLPWKLADIRPDVCYIGLVFKKDLTHQDEKTACCAAQMFLDSGDGLVFRGDVGPWYNPDTNEYHLQRESAKELLKKGLATFKKFNGIEPKEIFIHGRTFFNYEEWSGFEEAITHKTKLCGIRIVEENAFKLFRGNRFPVLRGTSLVTSTKKAFLWTKGFIPRLQSILGVETPNPLNIKIIKGEGDIHVVCKDILALTKLNYNTCLMCDGKPVTLKFANAIGEILTAGPLDDIEIALPFKYYI